MESPSGLQTSHRNETEETRVRVMAEEAIYRYLPSENGSGPQWGMGSSFIVRAGQDTYVSGTETLAGVEPLHNVRWVLYRRDTDGWEVVRQDEEGRTREPSPLLAFNDGHFFLSVNPTQTEPGAYSGAALPQVLRFSASEPRDQPKTFLPQWSEAVEFNEHSYRNVACDAQTGELILFQNLGMEGAYWCVMDAEGHTTTRGYLQWPWGADYEEPQAIRLCYCNVLIRGRAVYILGTSDIMEPVAAWREYKFDLTGRQWDYDFRRVYLSWTPDITSEPFVPWVKMANRDETAGHVQNCDLWLDEDGVVHALWREFAIDERLRERFFPEEKQRYSLEYGRLKNGEFLSRATVAEGGEGLANEKPDWGRFHVMPDGRLYVIYTLIKNEEDAPVTENRLVEIDTHGTVGRSVTLPLRHAFKSAFSTTTPRGGSPLSNMLEILGECASEPLTMRYARIELDAQPDN